MLEKMFLFLQSMKWRFYVSTLQIFLGYGLAVWPGFAVKDVLMLVLLFLIFGPLLHGGIYTLNDILDLNEDRMHPVKGKRPIASGRITLPQAYVFSFVLICLALLLSFWVNRVLVVVCLAFLLINMLYSIILKKIPYIEIIANALTHPLRFYAGVIAAGSFGFHIVALLLFLFAFSIAALKRKKEILERQQASRKVLASYSVFALNAMIVLAGILLLAVTVISQHAEFFIGIMLLCLYLCVVAGYHYSRSMKSFINRWY